MGVDWGNVTRLSVPFIPTELCYYNEKTRQVHKLPMLSADNWGGWVFSVSDASANVHMRYLCQYVTDSNPNRNPNP